MGRPKPSKSVADFSSPSPHFDAEASSFILIFKNPGANLEPFPISLAHNTAASEQRCQRCAENFAALWAWEGEESPKIQGSTAHGDDRGDKARHQGAYRPQKHVPCGQRDRHESQ